MNEMGTNICKYVLRTPYVGDDGQNDPTPVWA